MTSQPVSVIVPHYGDPKHALALVGQLESQVGAPEFEIIVVDDASPEPYPDDARVRLIRRTANGGFGAAVNSGAVEAKYSYLLVLNSDLSIGTTFVADLYAAAAPFRPAVVGPMVVGHAGASQWPGRKFPRTPHYFVEWLTILARFKDTRWRHRLIGHDVRAVAGATVAVDWVMGAALLIPTAEFRAVGGFDEGFHMNCEEVDLQRRLRMRGVPSIVAGTVSVTHAGGASSGDHGRRVQRLVESRLRYARKWGEHPGGVRAALIAASVVNLGTNAARRAAGRDLAPVRTLRTEIRAALASARTRRVTAPQSRPRIAFLTPWPIDDDRSWSGVIQPMCRALSEVADVVPISTADVTTALPDRALARLVGSVTGKKYLWEFGLANAWKRGRTAGRRVRAAKVDMVLAAAASVDVAFGRFGVPVVQVADATLKRVLGFYPMFTGLSPLSTLQARLVAAVATRRTERFLATSAWAADSLTADYGVAPSDVVVAPLGPAIAPDDAPVREEHDGPLRILVVAEDWGRKRGDACVAAVSAARRRGLAVSLKVVGGAPSDLPEWVTSLGRLSHAELSSVYASSDVLLDLSVATAASVVATDAAAHSLPVIALDTGGTSSIVLNGETGLLIPPDVDGDGAVVGALAAVAVPGQLRRMSAAALARSGQSLNWRSWAGAVLAGDAPASARRPESATVPPARDALTEADTRPKRIAMISPILPRKNPDNAGERYVASLVEMLTSLGAEVTLIVPRSERNVGAETSTVAPSYVLIPIADARMPRFGVVSAKLDRLRRTQPPRGFITGIERSVKARRVLAAADVLDIQWEEQATAIRRLKPLAPHARSIVTLHDVLAQKFDREAQQPGSPQAHAADRANQAAARYFERTQLKDADSVVVFSEKDRRLLPDTGRVSVVYPPVAIVGDGSRKSTVATSDLLFIGPLWRSANFDAVRWFSTEILPRVRKKVPSARLVVAGAVPPEYRGVLEGLEAVEALGFVDDLEPLYERAAAVVAPTRCGAGVKFEVVDALVRGVPVIATSVGAEGIRDPSFELPVYDSAEGFADAVARVLGNPQVARQAAGESREWARRRYGRPQFARRVAAIYGLATQTSGDPRQGRPDVSVVIPVRNGEGVISTQLEALSNQSEAHDIEVVVSDNGSTDRTVEEARAFSHCFCSFRIVDSGDRAGVSHARNVGARAATGKYVLFVDADDVVQPRYIAAMRDGLRTADVVGGVAVLDDGETPLDLAPVRGPLPSDVGGSTQYAIGCAMGVRRDVLLAAGGFDETFAGGHEEVDFARRARDMGFSISGRRDAVVIYRQRDTLWSGFRQYKRYATTAVLLSHRSGTPTAITALTFVKSSMHSLLRVVVRPGPFDAADRARAAGWWAGTVAGSIRYSLLQRVPAPRLIDSPPHHDVAPSCCDSND